MPSPRYIVRRENGSRLEDAGSLYELPAQVCLHIEDPELARALESTVLLEYPRPPYLDAAHAGIHGAYRPRPQINVFFQPPIADVVRALEGPLRDAGYTIQEAAAA